MSSYDCIVLGVGGFGSATAHHLAKRGARVLGVEQFGVAHDRGSSHGETRIIRMAYFEHPDYVPLLRRSFVLWRELEQETATSLFHQVGLFVAGARGGEAVEGTLDAARIHGLPVDELTALEARARFPGYVFPDGFQVVFESQAGYLEVEACVAAHVAAATRAGAEIRTGETARAWTASPAGVSVTTDRGTYHAARLVITAGPWAGRILAALGLPLRVVRKPLFWFPAAAEYDVQAGSPTFFYELPEGQFYGFPRIDGRTLKVAEHTGGQEVLDPLTVDRSVSEADVSPVRTFLKSFLPGVEPAPVRHSVCMYTKTPDSHFLIDRHPEHENVLYAAGFSGHGFKFTTAIGEALAEMALLGRTDLPIGFLSAKRFA